MRVKIIELTRSLHSSILILKKYKGGICTNCILFDKKKRICNYEEYDELSLTIEGLRSIYGPDILNPCDVIGLEPLNGTGGYSVIELLEDIGMSNFIAKLILRRYANVSIRAKRKKQQYSNRNQKN